MRAYKRRTPYLVCPRCWRSARLIEPTAADYAELLGLHLGDGFISNATRTARLRIFLDAKYPDIIRLFTTACDQVGVKYRATCWRGHWRVRINRRRSVERMLAEVGLKS